MKINETKIEILGIAMAVLFLVVTSFAFHLDSSGLIHSIGRSLSHFVVAIVNCIPVVFIAWFYYWIRKQDWFNPHHAQSEAITILARIGTDDEKANDSIAVSILVGSSLLFLSMLFVGFFLA